MTDRTSNWKPLDFQCRYACNYCPEVNHSIEPKLKEDWRDMPRDRTGVWVCGDTDLFHPDVPDYIIEAILGRASENSSHCYIFCTKNPQRYFDFLGKFPRWTYFVTTVESDIDYESSLASPPLERLTAMKDLQEKLLKSPRLRPQYDYQFNLDLQPIWDFTDHFLDKITEMKPHQVGIGRVIGEYPVKEPDFKKVMKLARALSKNRVRTAASVWELCLVNVNGCNVSPRSRFGFWPYRQ